MFQKIIGRVHSKFVFGRRIRAIANAFQPYLRAGLVLDVGCGNGMISKLLMDDRDDLVITGVDTLIRPGTAIPVLQYNGTALPFADHVFSTVLLVDVLHHTRHPQAVLQECARVCRENILIKDHFAETRVDLLFLKLLDWVGNRPHGVQLPYNYFSRKQWTQMVNASNLKENDRVEKIAGLYPIFFQKLIGEKIQFMSNLTKNVLERV
jgi:SAM-dependent methyltransferase